MERNHSLTDELILALNAELYELEILTLVFLFIITIKKNTMNSSIVAIVVSLLVGLFSLIISPKLMIFGTQNPDFKHEIRFLWYMGFIHIDLAAIYVIRKINGILKVELGDICKLILLMFIARIGVSSIRYAERVVFDTYYLEFLYKTSIQSINHSSTITVFLISIILIVRNTTSERVVSIIKEYTDNRAAFFPLTILTNKKWIL